jgi:hypothetical protein
LHINLRVIPFSASPPQCPPCQAQRHCASVVKKIVDDTIKVIYQLNHIKSKNHKILQTISLAPATIGASNPFKSISNPFISVLLRRRRPQNPKSKIQN